jgi:8-oxo-dGTP pyrophosphatase MutT (NUDIX family)
MTEKEVVSSFITHEGKLLLLKRSPTHKHGNKWGVVSGYIKENETPFQTALREISEEVSIDSHDLKLIKESGIIRIQEENIIWIIHPFLFEVNSDKVKVEHEHEEYKWIYPHEISKFDCIIGLEKDMKALGLI